MLEVLIIGSGPAGLSAAVYAKRAGLSVLVAEKEYLGTGQIAMSSQVDNYLGFPGIDGFELGERFREHAVQLGIPFYEGEAIRFEKAEEIWRVTFDSRDVLEAESVIFCGGARHQRLNVPGEERLTGKGVSYCVLCDGAFYEGKTAAMIGGGDTALDGALYLSGICSQVYLIHHREEFRGSAAALKKIRQKSNVEILTGRQVEEILGEEKVQALKLTDGHCLAVDGVFAAVGMIPQTDCLRQVVSLDEKGYILAGETGETSAGGFFAAGDARSKQLRQVVTAVADGANAAVAAADYLKKRQSNPAEEQQAEERQAEEKETEEKETEKKERQNGI